MAFEPSLLTRHKLATTEMLQRLDAAFNDVRISMPDGGPVPLKVAAACGLFHLAVEHACAIDRLMQLPELTGSAFALIRSQFESFVRGAWLFHCATPDEANAFANHDLLDLNMTRLIDAVETTHPDFSGGVLSQLKDRQWKSMCSFAHGGSYQIRRRISADEIAPNYSDADCVRMLRSARFFALLAAIEATTIARREEIKQILLKQLQREINGFPDDISPTA